MRKKRKLEDGRAEYTVYLYSKSRFRIYFKLETDKEIEDEALLKLAIKETKVLSKANGYRYSHKITDIINM